MQVLEILTADQRRRYVLLDEHGTLVEPVVRYLKHLDRRGAARNTLAAHAYGLKWYWEYLAEKTLDWRQPSLDSMADFVNWLRWPFLSQKVLPRAPVRPARSNSTINNYLTVVSCFYDYQRRVGEIVVSLREDTIRFLPESTRGYKGFLYGIADERPVAKHLLKQQEDKRSRPKTLGKAQVRQLRSACGNPRDRLLVGLLYETGMRVGEALALWVEDLDLAELVIQVRDRGPLENGAEIKTPAAERAIHVSEALLHEALLYVAQAHTLDIQTNHLFLKAQGSHAGQPLDYANVDALFQQLRHKTGIEATPHLLRHTHFTLLAEADWPPELLRERAGHASFHHTYQSYVHPSQQRLRKEWERVEQLGCLSLNE